ncbi:uncharacterized protein FFB14_15271 [Fusarium fujikuroi]|nr:uncharacterized protein FFB14_15271 [Fusarium fujikuroi]
MAQQTIKNRLSTRRQEKILAVALAVSALPLS